MSSLLFVLPVLFAWTAADPGYFKSEPKADPYYVKSGTRDLVLPCAVDPAHAAGSSVYWMRLVNSTPFLIRNDVFYELDNTTCNGCLNLHIKTVDYARDNGKFYCQLALPDGSTHTSKEAVIMVLVRPEKPELDKMDLVVSEGRPEEIKCRSVGGNPAPRISWFLSDGTDVSRMATVRNATNLHEPTVSTLALTASAEDSGQSLVCKVWNVAMGEGQPPLEVSTNPLTVLYPPKVTVLPNPYSVEAGQEARLYCNAKGNPMPTKFAWHRSGGVGDSTWVEQNISFIASREHAGLYTCTAESAEGYGQARTDLSIQYGPEISLLEEVIVKEGEDLRLKCQVDSNPEPFVISWTGPEVKIQNSSVLQLNSVTRRQAGTYTCEAKNRLTVANPSGPAERSQSRSSHVIVSYPPGKAIISVREPVLVGSRVTLNCSVEESGFPPVKFRWRLPGQADYEYVAQSVYTINDIQLSQAGDYWCLPFNDVGSGQESSYKLIVREPAHIVKYLKSEETVRQDQRGYSISCSASGNPLPNISWYYEDEPVPTDQFSILVRPEAVSCDIAEQCSLKVMSTLQWTSAVRWDNKGVYACRADNGAGVPAESTMFLKVQHRPVIINDPDRRTVTADPGDTVLIVCKVTASPEPIFRWYRNGDEVQDYDGSKVDTNQLRNHSLDVYENTLVIRTVATGDYGTYSCKASNLFGEDGYIFKLEGKSKPQTPKKLKAESQTCHSLLLVWTPGFDGGHAQKYTIEMSHDGQVLMTFEIPYSTESYEWKPSLGVERVRPMLYNVTGLEPSTFYTFRMRAFNQLGESAWTQPLNTVTKDAPLNMNIKPPESAVYNSMTLALEFKPIIDTSQYCLMIYLQKDSGLWERWDCSRSKDKVDSVPIAANLRVRTCRASTMECSEAVPVAISVATSIGWEVIAAICCTILVGFIVCAVLCLYCRRQRRKLGKSPMANGTLMGKDGDARKAPIREISAPVFTDQLLNGSNLGVDRHTASSKDSGVFTTFSNYHLDGLQPDVSGHVYSEGNTLPRPISYEEADHWTVSGCRLSQNQGCPDAADLAHLKLTTVYGGPDFIDMNPAGGSLCQSREDSVHSGYSTPLQKRIIREIIV